MGHTNLVLFRLFVIFCLVFFGVTGQDSNEEDLDNYLENLIESITSGGSPSTPTRWKFNQDNNLMFKAAVCYLKQERQRLTELFRKKASVLLRTVGTEKLPYQKLSAKDDCMENRALFGPIMEEVDKFN